MSEAVKRYCMRAFGSIVQPIEVPYSGTWVPSADHDRIVAGLRSDYEYAFNSGEVARAECDTLRAEVEQFKAVNAQLSQLNVARRRHLANAKKAAGIGPDEDLVGTIELLRKDAERYRLLRAGNDYQYDGPMVVLYEKSSDVGERPYWSLAAEALDETIDAALEASR